MIFIAEIKVKSPFTDLNRPASFEMLRQLAINYSDMISVHVEAPWGGNPNHINQFVRPYCQNIPILAKGIHATDEDIKNSLNYGADKVLVVGRIPRESLRPYCWIEPENLEQVREFTGVVQTLVWNSRCLKTGRNKEETWESARALHSGPLIQASNISGPSDVKADAEGIIVGTRLKEYISAAGLKKHPRHSWCNWVAATSAIIKRYRSQR